MRRIIQFFFPLPILTFLVALRKTEYYTNCEKPNLIYKAYAYLLRGFYTIKLRKISIKLGFTIPINTFGPGLSIPHYGTIVVSRNARIGANCRLHTCVNIGASAGKKEAPQIGDNCYIGPGAILFGDIHLANNVTIGANATVNKSFEEDNIVLAGTPAKIVKTNVPAWNQKNPHLHGCK